MKILIDDVMQYSAADQELRTPALADTYDVPGNFIIDLKSTRNINCIGIGNTDGVNFTFDGRAVTFDKNGLYILDSPINDNVISVAWDGTYIGRLAMGVYRQIGTSPKKEIGFFSTEQNRITSSGQVQPGAGGISGRKQSLDSRYKIDRDIYDDIAAAYPDQISKLFPFFINFADEFKIPYDYFYGGFDKNDLSFQGAINKFLYSERFDFYERY